MKTPSQVELIDALLRELDHQGFGQATLAQLNVVYVAAGLVASAYREPDADEVEGHGDIPNMKIGYIARRRRPATPGEIQARMEKWMTAGGKGRAERALATYLGPIAGLKVVSHKCTNHPQDPYSFGRCLSLLDAVPELRPHLPRMAEVSCAWARLVDHWRELELLWCEESPSREAPKLYHRMRELIEGKPEVNV